ncbi:TetR family transcriptional regulator [Uliginosibacterium sp. sgz301328]|uniref:TetR family transcriptional regulator n=1 Tax=Uliginosibacterium sp. sgz301328 TaxID=3243764 RepID=UPI00359EFF43
MANSRDDVGVRLQQAALGLFRERGYDQTTAAEIAARAGVTERTFFRYFPDKREVLFDGESRLEAALAASIAEAPDGLGALDMLFRAFRSVQSLLEGNRPFSGPRHEIISSTPALHERELAKIAALTDALAEALKARGVPDLQAALAARAGVAAFAHATSCWLEDPSLGLGDRIDLAYRELGELLGRG